MCVNLNPQTKHPTVRSLGDSWPEFKDIAPCQVNE
jgi:hypothetical protein